jgi:hypothetical protein
MKATNAYAAKRALMTYLATVSPFTGNDPVQLQYARDGQNIGPRAVYGGGARFTQRQEGAEGGLRFETVTIGLYVRVLQNGGDVQSLETSVESIADVVATSLDANPALTDSLTFEQIVGGSADFYAMGDGTYEGILSLSVQLESHLING